ncbi:Radical SAM superfamily enzyme, MoaA/NifB/PqqE/SkfB family [Thermosyntropha lipolytica DSM 11003]|uniref:Radical SAM superfamily enzyme, MoaA/NifB/PqqE/SkfB family n=1 Tax=Thermosyntropha lipolytica DSM 11003 TaxID=1123382 RepID=A0A1M5RWC0_9FIRM|nr:radical SAM protein [Thermosyntropha lipolytica]SHH30479.1 Radical SAM superfamily enzyme, MoaA/NifB/PqqE/SkfB family [Thermosyntropha lipolytica DSM 11003]
MKSAKQLVSSVVLKEGLHYVEKNPMENLNKLINWGEKLAVKENHKEYARNFRRILNQPGNNWRHYVERLFTELHPHVRQKVLINFVVNSGLAGMPLAEKMGAKHGCNIPWAILMDPTAACNLKCTGCWAAEYEKTSSLDYQTLNRIIEEGKELGIYMYIYSGGEPLIRKKDLIKLARKHDDCMFLSFTNGTLVDEELAQEMQKAGNFALAISVEGFEEETDMRRGQGTFKKVMAAMDILKKYGVPFGFSTCYHSQNTAAVGSDEYIDLMIEKGCIFGWYFTYIPLGKDAKLELLATPEQREWMYHRIRQLRDTKPIFLMDFWNDGEYTGGCIAGGRRYFHINANGDVEPCAFIHYSNVNIKEVSLLEALKCDLFKHYQAGQPFNDNHLRPCPLLDNPHKLREIVHASGAYSTQLMDLESVDTLTAKCEEISRKWAVTADRLWQESQKQLNCSQCQASCSRVG